MRGSSNLASRENTYRQSEDQASQVVDEDSVSVIQETIGALERTLADNSIPRGHRLESALQRQLSVRRSELSNQSNHSRRNSVIVTSTPDISQGHLNPFNPEENLSLLRRNSDPPPYSSREHLSAPPQYSPAEFQVFQDPPSYRQPLGQIPIVITPALSSVGVGQENIPPQFLFPTPSQVSGQSQGQNMSSDEEDAEVERIKAAFARQMKNATIKTVSMMKLYDVDKYTAVILKNKETDWLARIETHATEVQDIVMSYLDHDWITETIQKDAEDALNLFMSKITDYMLAYQTKILNIQAPVQAPGANADPSVGNSLSTSSSSNGGNNQAAKTASAVTSKCYSRTLTTPVQWRTPPGDQSVMLSGRTLVVNSLVLQPSQIFPSGLRVVEFVVF